jgi:hypothetical protein
VNHHQAAKPARWEIADEATTPDGRHLTGTVARVYNLLAETARRRHKWAVGRHQAPAGWVPTWVLREPWAGGSAGDRRLRDLRDKHGIAVEGMSCTAGDRTTSSWIWRLSSPAAGDATPRKISEASPSAQVCGPLAGLSLSLLSVPVRERPDGSLDVSPGGDSPLAPSLAVADDATYRRELLAAFHAGRLVPALLASESAVLWTDSAAGYDPRPLLRLALAKLGATVGG